MVKNSLEELAKPRSLRVRNLEHVRNPSRVIDTNLNELRFGTAEPIELSDAGGPGRPIWKVTWPARIRSSDLVSLHDE